MTGPERSLMDRTDRNRAAARLLPLPHAVAAASVVGLVLGVLVAWWLGVLAGLVVGAAVIVVLPRTVVPGLATVFGARPASEAEHPRLHNLVEGLTVTSGASVPNLHVVDDPGLNLATYGEPDDATIVATTGLLDSLDRVELEAVVAEAMQRIRSCDAHLGGQAALLVCGPLVKVGPLRPGRSLGSAALFGGARARRLKTLLGPQREFLSDLAAIDLTRYPPGLESALGKMDDLGSSVASATWGTAHLWIADPLAPSADPAAQRLNELFAADAPIEQRASLMAEL